MDFCEKPFKCDTIIMTEETWNSYVEADKALMELKRLTDDFRKLSSNYRKSTTLEKRSKKISVKHRHNNKFKSFWSKQKSNRFA